MTAPTKNAEARRPSGPEYLRLVADAGGRGRNSTQQFVRHPIRTLRMTAALGRMPLLDDDLGDGPTAASIREALAIGSGVRRLVLRSAAYVLPIPEDPEAFGRGSSRKLLRNSASNAARRGVTWGLVGDPEERRELLRAADEFERNHPQVRYRGDAPDNSVLLEVPLWVVMRSAEGEPLVLAMVAIDGAWGLLRYSRLMQDSETASFARYFMMMVLGRLASERGVRHLVADGSPLRVSPGLYYFMQRVGFETFRVRPRHVETLRRPEAATGRAHTP